MRITVDILGPANTPTATPSLTPTATPTPTVVLIDGLSVNDVAILEGNSGLRSAVFTISLQGRHRDPVSVTATTADGTAVAGSDYVARSTTLTFPASATSVPFAVSINGDRGIEPHETFTVTLSNPVGAPIGDAFGVGTILSDEGLDVGVPELSPASPVTAPGDLTELALRWEHPERWRELDTVDLRLLDGDRPVFWARFDEAANTLAPCDAAGVCGDGVTPGTGAPIDLGSTTFHPADSAVQGSGPTGPSVDLVFALTLDRSLGGRVLRIETAARDDSGAEQNFQPIGYLEVAPASASAQHDDDGCAVQPPRGGSGAGALALGLLALVALRRRRCRRPWSAGPPRRSVCCRGM
jgi:MYXO-CTERM domain-containing protein